MSQTDDQFDSNSSITDLVFDAQQEEDSLTDSPTQGYLGQKSNVLHKFSQIFTNIVS